MKATLDRIMERIEDGYQTADQILFCGECGAAVFELTPEEVEEFMEELVQRGRAEWHDQGKAHLSSGSSTVRLCVPKGTPQGSDYRSGRPRGDENLG